MSTSDYSDTHPTPIDATTAVMLPITTALRDHDITPQRLAKALDQELTAGETKAALTPDGWIYSDPDQTPAWKIRQEARKDAHRLLNHYPAERSQPQLQPSINIYIGGRSIHIESAPVVELEGEVLEITEDIHG